MIGPLKERKGSAQAWRDAAREQRRLDRDRP